LSTDDLVFNATSVINAATTANLAIGSITITSAYTGQWTSTHQITFNNAAGFSDSGITGTHSYGTVGMIFNSNTAVIYIAPASISYYTSCPLTTNGTTVTIDMRKVYRWGKLTIAANCNLKYLSTSTVDLEFDSATTVCTFGAGASLTHSQTSRAIYFHASASQTMFSMGAGAYFDGNGAAIEIVAGNDSIIMNIPALEFKYNSPSAGNYIGTVFYDTDGYNNVTFEIDGNQKAIQGVGTTDITLYGYSGDNAIFNFNNSCVITCDWFNNDFGGGTGSTDQINFKDCTINCIYLTGLTDGAHVFTMGTAKINSVEGFKFRSLQIVSSTGKDVWNLGFGYDATMQQDAYLNQRIGPVYYDAMTNSVTCTLNTNIWCELFTLKRGSLNYNGKTLFAGKDYADNIH
jgi:hypothetical protein